MERYNFRTTSLNNDQLNSELAKRGAQTFGSVQRKQQRLQRFIDAEEARMQEPIRVVIKRNVSPRNIDGGNARAEVRRHILMGRRSMIGRLINDYLGY